MSSFLDQLKAKKEKLANAQPLQQRPTVPNVNAEPQPQIQAPSTDPTLKEIGTTGVPSGTFYLAASQPLLAKLKYQDRQGKSYDHTPFFKNMVGTLMLETARRAPGPGHETSYARRMSWTIESFSTLWKSTQLIILDNLWEDCYKAVSPSTPASAMVDGDNAVDTGKSLPSSVRPAANTGFFTRIAAGPQPQAWTRWKIGFRIDGGKGRNGSSRDDLTRVSKEGTWPLQKKPDLAVQIVQKFYHELNASRSTDLYIGYQNRDLYNESGTCVARSLFGATAFPYRDTENARDGLKPNLGGDLDYQYLFAIDCGTSRGVDTEKVQMEMGNNSLWRPGEKAFGGFAADRILGWTRVVRMGQPNSPNVLATGWSFKFVDSRWSWLKAPGGELQTFLEEELASWAAGQQYTIASSYDFLNA